GFAAEMEMRLEIGDQGVLLEHRKAIGRRNRVWWDINELLLPQPGKGNQITALLWFLTFRIEPDADLGSRGDFLADRVQMLVPGDLLARQNQFARAVAEPVVTFTDRPLHQLRTTVDEINRCWIRRRG